MKSHTQLLIMNEINNLEQHKKSYEKAILKEQEIIDNYNRQLINIEEKLKHFKDELDK